MIRLSSRRNDYFSKSLNKQKLEKGFPPKFACHLIR